MPNEFVYRNCRVVIGFELAGHRRYRGVATVSLEADGQELTHELRPDETYDDWGEAGRRVEQAAREWIDHKRG
jgi:hypothetical protein